MFMMGTSSLEWTRSGVRPDPNTMPIGLDIPMRMVARVRWSSPNHSWNGTFLIAIDQRGCIEHFNLGNYQKFMTEKTFMEYRKFLLKTLLTFGFTFSTFTR